MSNAAPLYRDRYVRIVNTVTRKGLLAGSWGTKAGDVNVWQYPLTNTGLNSHGFEWILFPTSDGSYLIDGTVPIRDLNRELDWSLPDEGATTGTAAPNTFVTVPFALSVIQTEPDPSIAILEGRLSAEAWCAVAAWYPLPGDTLLPSFANTLSVLLVFAIHT